tara:strand:- start:9687 stop:10004 length:318 start_codon:yes stop_codon:yes gene_type:complete
MGKQIFDQFTYLHFASGIVAYFWNISILNWLILHSIFEFLENTKFGMNFINKYLFVWPGGKSQVDALSNILGDTIGTLLGWLSAYYLDKIGNHYNWYDLHIKKNN